MMQSNNHLLAKYGIMTNFSIAKKITKKQLKSLTDKFGSSNDLSEVLRNEILKETKLAIHNNKIPGIITNEKFPIKASNTENPNATIDLVKKTKLMYFSTLVIQKISDQNLTKDECCFIIVNLINGLGLKESDFKKFHDSNNSSENTESNESNEDEPPEEDLI